MAGSTKGGGNIELYLEDVRLSYPALFQKKAFNDDPKAEPKYSAQFIIDPDSRDGRVNHNKILDAIDDAIVEKWPDKKDRPRFDDSDLCYRDGNKTKKVKEELEDMFYLSASNSSRPMVLDPEKRPVYEDDNLIYAGCYVDTIVRIWAMDNKWGQRVNASLEVVRYRRKGDAFGAAPVDVEKMPENRDYDPERDGGRRDDRGGRDRGGRDDRSGRDDRDKDRAADRGRDDERDRDRGGGRDDRGDRGRGGGRDDDRASSRDSGRDRGARDDRNRDERGARDRDDRGRDSGRDRGRDDDRGSRDRGGDRGRDDRGGGGDRGRDRGDDRGRGRDDRDSDRSRNGDERGSSRDDRGSRDRDRDRGRDDRGGSDRDRGGGRDDDRRGGGRDRDAERYV